ncbi:hypothetical protein FQR65_LT20945 [Abscondita terminalis]|nr:hypothetical protein FQR65_LT20945 [Abscondita terminalis]
MTGVITQTIIILKAKYFSSIMGGLQLSGISRSFGNNTVLHGVDLSVRRGEIVGFVGGNGSGKTTTMRLILGLSERANTLLQDLSLGNQQRVQLAVALVGEPALLILDEPFSGLDPLAVDTMAELIREQAARGVGALFSSHQIDLVERISDRVCVLNRGQVVASGSTAELQKSETTSWRITCSQEITAQLLAELTATGKLRAERDEASRDSISWGMSPTWCDGAPALVRGD